MAVALLWLWLVAPPTPDQARALLGRPPAELVAEYRAFDAGFRDGLGNSDEPTSGGLAWSETPFLRNYMSCYLATGDSYWLDKVIDHVDRMLANQTDRNGDGHPAWDTQRYSIGRVRVGETIGARGLRLEPTLQREPAARQGNRITGHRYGLVFTADDVLRLVDLTEQRVLLDDLDYAGELALDLFSGTAYPTLAEARRQQAVCPLELRGPGRAGATFVIDTIAPGYLEYVVHDGVIGFPIAQFIEVGLTRAELPERYRRVAGHYLDWFDRHLFGKWERCWRALDAETGAYTFTTEPSAEYPGAVLPHSHYLALARACLPLLELPAATRRGLYRARVEAMARYFRRQLRLQRQETAWVWNTWDPPGERLAPAQPEDFAHAPMDVGFVAEAIRRGIVFEPADAVRFARTFTDVMARQTDERWELTQFVDGSGPARYARWFDWALLGEWDARAFELAVLLAGGQPATWPQLLEVLARLEGGPR